jgi:hypothetical protein
MRLFARAFTSAARVTFPSSSADTTSEDRAPSHGNHVRRLRIGSLARLTGLPRGRGDMHLVSTSDSEVVQRLFDDPVYPWWMQGTFALLTSRDAPPPAAASDDVRALLSEAWMGAARSVAPGGAVLRPGVDGDVAGLLTFTRSFEDLLLDAVELECRRTGTSVWRVQEDAFAARLAL